MQSINTGWNTEQGTKEETSIKLDPSTNSQAQNWSWSQEHPKWYMETQHNYSTGCVGHTTMKKKKRKKELQTDINTVQSQMSQRATIGTSTGIQVPSEGKAGKHLHTLKLRKCISKGCMPTYNKVCAWNTMRSVSRLLEYGVCLSRPLTTEYIRTTSIW